jgi:hypothetical protein
LAQQGGESDASKFQATITLFREEEYGKMEEKKIFSAQRSYTGKVRLLKTIIFFYFGKTL